MIDMIPIQSDNIDLIGYEEETNTLHIKLMNSSNTHLYKNISMDTFIELLYNKEKFKFLETNIFSKYEKIAV